MQTRDFKENELALKIAENELGYQLEMGNLSPATFEKAFQSLRKDWIEYRKKETTSLHKSQIEERTKACMASHSLCFDRIIIGASTAATMVFDQLSLSAREKVLVLNDTTHPSTWLNGSSSRLLTQGEALQAPGFFEPASFVIDEANESLTNPYHYSRMQNLAFAQMEKQNKLNMPIVNFKAGQIESKSDLWEQDYPYRIPLLSTDDHRLIKYAYTNHIDICVGLGSEKNLSEDQISSYDQSKALKNKTLIFDPQDSSQLRDGVIFYGNSAGCATMIAEIVQRKKQDLKEPMIGGWYTRSKGDFDPGKMVTTLNRLVSATIADEKRKKASLLHDGYTLKKIETVSEDSLSVTFQMTNGSELLTILCPQIAITISQDPFNLTENLNQAITFNPVIENNIPLGVISNDGGIAVWGAAASTKAALITYLKNEKQAEILFQLITDHANTLPYESKVQPGIFNCSKKIEWMAKSLSKNNLFSLREKIPREKYFKQINLASREELVEIFKSNSNDYSPEKLSFFADKVIKERSKIQNPSVKKMGGIHSAEHLACLKTEIPLDLLNALKEEFFPHAALFKQTKSNLLSFGLFAAAATTIGVGCYVYNRLVN